MNRQAIFILFWLFMLPAALIAQTDTTVSDTLVADTLAPHINKSKAALSAEVKYEAEDSIKFNIKDQTVELFGNARVDYGQIQLNAAYIFINFKESRIEAEGLVDTAGNLFGTPVFTESGREFRSKRMAYNFKTRRGVTYDIITQEGEGYIHGQVVKKNEYDVLLVKNAAYTTCDLDHPHYSIQSNKVKVIPGKQIITGPAKMVVEDVPLPFYLPFGFFPNTEKQASGIVIPAYGEDRRGFFLRNGGYFFSVSDYFNFAVLGDIYSRGDYRLELSTNYAKRYSFMGGLSFNYAYEALGNPEEPGTPIQRVYNLMWRHTQDPRTMRNASFSANVNLGSSNFLRDYSTNTQDRLTNTINSSINYSKRFLDNKVSLSVNLGHSQNTLTRTMDFTLPEVNLSMTRIYPFKNNRRIGPKRWYEDIGVSYRMDLRNQLRTYDTLLGTFNILDSLNYGAQHSIPVNFNFNILRYISVTPSLRYNGYFFTQKVEKFYNPTDTSITDSVVHGYFMAHSAMASINFSTTVFGMLNINRGGIVALRHVLTPNVGLSYSPDYSNRQFNYIREVQRNEQGETLTYNIFEENVYSFGGGSDQASMNFSLNNNFEMKVRQTTDTSSTIKKIKLLDNLTLNGNYNFLKDTMQLSNIGITGNTRLFDRLQVNFGGTLSPYHATESRITKEYEVDVTGKLVRLVNATMGIRANLNPKGRRSEAIPVNTLAPELPRYYTFMEQFASFDIPWNLAVGYNLTYNKQLREATISQRMDLNGDVNLTENWKIGFTTAYDFTNKTVGYTSIDIFRDLHCWEMKFNMVPFGRFRSYYFTLRVKASMLSDLKLDKRQDFRNNLEYR